MFTAMKLFLSLYVGAYFISTWASEDLHTTPAATLPLMMVETPPFVRSSPKDLDWMRSRMIRMGVRLVDAIKDASYPVMLKVDDIYYPLCEDSFNDQTAQALCEAYNYERGYKTTYTLADDAEFSFTNLECYQTQWTESAGFDDDNLTHIRGAAQKCLLKDYSDKNADGVYPCSRNQGAAVYCYDLRRVVTWQPLSHNVQIGENSWAITFTLNLFKLGRRVSHFGKDGVKDLVSSGQFAASACGNRYTPKVKYPDNHKYFEISGKFRRNCQECVDLYFLNHTEEKFLYFWSVCRDD